MYISVHIPVLIAFVCGYNYYVVACIEQPTYVDTVCRHTCSIYLVKHMHSCTCAHALLCLRHSAFVLTLENVFRDENVLNICACVFENVFAYECVVTFKYKYTIVRKPRAAITILVHNARFTFTIQLYFSPFLFIFVFHS